MAREFLGTGWGFPFAVSTKTVDGDRILEVETSSHDANIAQSIEIILRTAKGERVMRPDFGCGLHELVFAVANTATASRAEEEVRAALIRWEPRIELLDVQANFNPREPNTLLIHVQYRVRSTNNVFNQVYPFYLERSGL